MMIFCNCSSRGPKSNSNYFLDRLEELILQNQDSSDKNQQIPVERVHLNQLTDINAFCEKLSTATTLVLSMPLYVDGIPSHVIHFMEQIYEKQVGKTSKLMVYGIGNLGFYESHQLRILLSMIKNWAEKCGFTYGGGLAVGAGEMMGGLRNVPLDKGPNVIFGKGIQSFAKHVSENTLTETIHTKPYSYPRWLYIKTVNHSWPAAAKQNGLKKKDLNMKRLYKSS